MSKRHPGVLIELDEHPAFFLPNQAISGRYRVDLSQAPCDVEALECSIGWATEGKGVEDQGVHAVALIGASDKDLQKADQWRRFEAILPRSPFSYDGVLIKVRWRVCVRVIFGRKKEWVCELPFRLGNVDPPRETEGKTP